MPEIVRIPAGTGQFGKERTKKLFVCCHSNCAFRTRIIEGGEQPSMAEIRQHEADYRNTR